MNYILDTNIYRRLTEDKSLSEVIALVEQVKRNEKQKNYKGKFSIIVAMELIKHLVDEDPYKADCYKALCLLFHHTTYKVTDAPSPKIDYCPPYDVVLPSFFCGNNGKHKEVYETILKLTYDLTKDYNIQNINNKKAEIELVQETVLYIKEEIHGNYKNYLSELNNDVLDWEIFANDKPLRDKWFLEIKNKKSSYRMAESFMKRAYSLSEPEMIYERSEENLEKLKGFYVQFYPAILMCEFLLKQFGGSYVSLRESNKTIWNTVTDISILIGFLYSKEDILVTEDKNIQRCFADPNFSNRLKKLDWFKKEIVK